MGKTILGVCTFIEITGIVGLTAIALKRNNDAYKAELKCIDLQRELIVYQIDNITKDANIRILKKDNEKLKKQLGEA